MNRHCGALLNATINEAGPPLSPLPSPPKGLRDGWRFAFPLLIVLYLAIAFTHAWLAPSGGTGYQNAPDEAAHVTFARIVALGRLPSREYPGLSGGNTGTTYEWHQPPLYYLFASRFLSWGDKGMRFASILIGVCCILVVYSACRVLLPQSPEVSVLASAIVALTPGHCAITSVVSNDGLLELCFSSFLLVAISALVHGLSSLRSVLLGVLLGAALLTKVTAVLLFPIALIALMLFRSNGESRGIVLRSGVIIFSVACAISGWWFVRNYWLYHEWLPLTVFREAFAGTAKASDIIAGHSGLPVDSVPSYAALVANWTFQSFWAVYSTDRDAIAGIPRFLPVQLYLLFSALTCAAVAGILRVFLRRRSLFNRAQLYGLSLNYALLSLIVISFAVFVSHFFQAQGRYLYPAMLPIALSISLGWRALFPPRYAGMASALLIACLGMFCLAFLRYVV